MMWSDDPERDFLRYDREQERKLARRPICDLCQEHIQEDHYFYVEGQTVCPDCLDIHYSVDIEEDI